MDAVLAGRQTRPAVRNIGRKTVDFGSVELCGSQDFVLAARALQPLRAHARKGCKAQPVPKLFYIYTLGGYCRPQGRRGKGQEPWSAGT